MESLKSLKAAAKKAAAKLRNAEAPIEVALATVRNRRKKVDGICLPLYYALGVALSALRSRIMGKSNTHEKASQYKAYWHGELELSAKQESEARSIAESVDDGRTIEVDGEKVKLSAAKLNGLSKNVVMQQIRSTTPKGKVKPLPPAKAWKLLGKLQKDYEVLSISLPTTAKEKQKWLAEINGLDRATLATALEASEAILAEIERIGEAYSSVQVTDTGDDLLKGEKIERHGKKGKAA